MLRAATGSTKDQGCLEVRNMSMCNQQCFIKEKKWLSTNLKSTTPTCNTTETATRIYIYLCVDSLILI